MEKITIEEMRVVSNDTLLNIEYRAIYNFGVYRELTFALYPGKLSGMVGESLMTNGEDIYRGEDVIGRIVPPTW